MALSTRYVQPLLELSVPLALSAASGICSATAVLSAKTVESGEEDIVVFAISRGPELLGPSSILTGPSNILGTFLTE